MCIFFSFWPYRTSLFQCLVNRTSFFNRLTVPKKIFSSLTPSRTSFPRAFRRPERAFLERFAIPRELFQLFSSAEPSKGCQRCPLEGHGAPKVRSAGTKYSQMDAQRGETGVPTTIEAQKQENVKKRAPSRRELDFRGIREVPNKLFRAFSRSS